MPTVAPDPRPPYPRLAEDLQALRVTLLRGSGAEILQIAALEYFQGRVRAELAALRRRLASPPC